MDKLLDDPESIDNLADHIYDLLNEMDEIDKKITGQTK